MLIDTTTPLDRARTLAVRDGRALRLRVTAEEAWSLRVFSLGAARRLASTLSGTGPDVLLIEGPAADLTLDHHESQDAPF
ncbi:hypothetical protein AB0D46_24665 [Streptomyces sp. NPDC048383]|uniref:hypothetical protein n=1 Tax=Streptomyces sp. NPDC048383 TaxID=3155386 RepID=UPI00343D40BD